jgi:pyrroloquinoline quinone biosynthesis protein D
MNDAIPADQDAHVLLFPEGMIKLSESASHILTRCDDVSTLDDIVGSLEQAFPGADLKDDVIQFMQVALDKGWIALR